MESKQETVPEGESQDTPAVVKPKARRGFAAMSPEKQRAIASRGGKAAHRSGKGHQWTSEEATEAARRAVAVRKGKKS